MKTGRYKIYRHGNETIAVSTYAGKSVRGRAIAHPDDKFDPDKGADLAVARCAAKIAAKRQKRATEKRDAAYKALVEAQRHYNDMVHYYLDANVSLTESNELVDNLLERYKED